MEHCDEAQNRIVALHGTTAMVLAGPGCGKTHVLARRVHYACTELGIDAHRMLCITFTNRAAREMKQRIDAYMGTPVDGLFVGNIHRFCLRFLFANNLLPDDTSVLDEDDLADYLKAIGYQRHISIGDFQKKVAYLYQTEHDHPYNLIQSPGRPISDEDLFLIKKYNDFKKRNGFVDFDEILLRTYTALCDVKASEYEMTGYSWAQVDEVQDMTPLQLALVDKICSHPHRTVLYFGDEQQAIFDFLGAGAAALRNLKNICRGKILRLHRNYRSPKRLVEMCNTLANRWLDIDEDLLPTAHDSSEAELKLYEVNRFDNPLIAGEQVLTWSAFHPDEDIAVLVRTNDEGLEVAKRFNDLGLDFFHISKQDLFHQIPFKTAWSHMAVVANPMNRFAWARLLYQTKTVKTLSAARSLVIRMNSVGIAPSHLLNFLGEDSVSFFNRMASDGEKTIVVFDTETTGLDTFDDDIVQISAVKMRGGRVVVGSEFNVFIATDKPLPATLSNGEANPLIALYSAAQKLGADDAFTQFLSYADGCILAGHNVEFDISILRNNITRRTAIAVPQLLSKRFIDSLDLSILLLPPLQSHRLAYLIEYLEIDGVNSHIASDDALATAYILEALHPLAQGSMEHIFNFLSDATIQKVALRFERAYGAFYQKYRRSLEENNPKQNLSWLLCESEDFFVSHGYTEPIQRMDYLCELINRHIILPDESPSLRCQLSLHLNELLTFNESDLFSKGIVKEKISIMTIHKAKGLEMDNVFVYNTSRMFGDYEECARILFVAFSRAKRRLSVATSGKLSRPMQSVAHFFKKSVIH